MEAQRLPGGDAFFAHLSSAELETLAEVFSRLRAALRSTPVGG
jgi:hypothetical protein